MIVSFHAAAHIAINCIPINWNLPISFGMFRQAERAVEQQQLSLRPVTVTPQDLECSSPSKEHRRRGKSYPDKAVTVSHGPIYNRCKEFIEKGPQSVLPVETQKPASKVQQTGVRTAFSINRKNGRRDLIGQGAFGTVYKGNYRGKEVAIKVTGVPAFRKETEGQVFARIGTHPHVISLHTFYRDGYGADRVETLVLEYAPADLSKMVNVIATDPCLDYTAYVADCLANALGHIHKRGYAHLDVSPGNVLLMRNGVAKLADFSSSLKWKIGHKPLEVYPVGTVGFRAPEVIEQHGYDTGADWFSLGVLVYYMINVRLPWERDDIAQMDFIRSGKPGLTNALPAAFSSFVSDLLSDEPDLRITEDVLSFLKDEPEL